MTHNITDQQILIVVLPGFCCKADIIVDTLRHISDDYRVIGIDYPELFKGASSCKGKPGIDFISSALNQIIRNNTHRRIYLIGWSIGFTLLLAYIKRHGFSNITGLVCIDQSPCLLLRGNWQYGAFGMLTYVMYQEMKGKIKNDYILFLHDIYQSFSPENKNYLDEFTKNLFIQGLTFSTELTSDLFSFACENDFRDFVCRLNCPVLYFMGGKSRVYDTGLSSWYKKNCMKSKVVIFEESGHMPFVDEKCKFVNEILYFIRSYQE